MAINERLIHTAANAAGGETEGLILHLDANDVDSYDGDGTVWYDITNHEYTPAVDPAEHFNTVTYTGNGSTGQSITGIGFQPDIVWIKNRDDSEHHTLFDSLSGADYTNYVNLALGQGVNEAFASFDTDGFTLDTDHNRQNANGDDYVAWCLKAGGAAVSNTDGSVTSQVSVNNDLGLSIVKYTTVTGAGLKVGHGMDVIPELVIWKRTDSSGDWFVYSSLFDGDYIRLNSTNGKASGSSYSSIVSSTLLSSFSGTADQDFVAYCFASKRGVSKVGSYIGTGAAGNKVYTGFQPAFVMLKKSSASGGSWLIVDNKRKESNNNLSELFADTTTAESGTGYDIDFNANGFTLNTTTGNANTSGATYIYLAFAAEKPSSLTPDRDSFTEGSVTSGFEMELKANDYSGSGNWLDSTSNDNDGTISGATYVNDGESDYFDFDGNDSVTSTGDLSVPNQHFTVEFWTKPDSTSTSQNFFELEDTSGNRRVSMVVNTGSTFRCYIYRASDFNNSTAITSAATFQTGRWYHVAVTFEKGVAAKIYIDGELDGTSTTSVSDARPTTYGETNIGTGAFGSLTGAIGQFRFYSSVLTAAEVKDNYDAGKGLYTYPKLELHYDPANTSSYSGTGTTLTDLAGNNNADLLGGIESDWDEELGNSFPITGSGDGITTSSTVSINPATTGMTVEIWFKIDSDSQNYLFSFDGTGTTWNALSYRANVDKVAWFYRTGSNAGTTIYSPTVTVNKWHHLVATTDGSGAQIYLDGEVGGTTTNNAYSVTYNEDLHFGNLYDLAQNSNTDIGQIRFYKGHLTAEQVMQNYRFTKNDYPNGFNGTLSGGLSSSDWNSSGYFDLNGSSDYIELPTSNNYFSGKTNNLKTLAFWVKADTVTARQRLFSISENGNSNEYFAPQWITDNNALYISIRKSTSSNQAVFTAPLTGSTDWKHIVFVGGDGVKPRMYVNGSSVTVTTSHSGSGSDDDWITYAGDVISSPKCYLGNLRHTSPEYSDGKLGSVKLYDKVLSANEVAAEFNNTKSNFGL